MKMKIFMSVVVTVLLLILTYILDRKFQKNENLQWVREGEAYIGNQFLSMISFVGISVFILLAMFFWMSFDWSNKYYMLLKDSGILLIIEIIVTGVFARMCYNVLAKWNQYKNLYRLQPSDEMCGFIIAILMFAFIYVGIKDYKMALTALSILLGRFLWFDTSKAQGKELCKSMEDVPLTYWLPMTYVLIITVFVCFFENEAISSVIGIVASWIISFIWIFWKKYKNSKSSEDKTT